MEGHLFMVGHGGGPDRSAPHGSPGGFFALRRDQVALQEVRPGGFKLLFGIAARNLRICVVEVPMVFCTRCKGTSKMRPGIVVEFLLQRGLLFLRKCFKTEGELPRFLAVGLMGAPVDFLAFYAGKPRETFSQDLVGADAFGYAFWSDPKKLVGRDAIAVVDALKREKIRLLIPYFEKVKTPMDVDLGSAGRKVATFLLVPCKGISSLWGCGSQIAPGARKGHQPAIAP